MLLGAAFLGSCRGAQEAPKHEQPVTQTLDFPYSEELGTWRVAPALSPDGRTLAYVRAGALRIRNTDSTAERSLSIPDSADWRPASASWHPDGERLLSLERHRQQGWRLALTAVATGERRIVPLPKNGTKPPAVSSDGRRVAIVRATESWDERDELLVIELPGGAERVLVKPGRGDILSSVAWSPEGDRVAFLVSHSGREDRGATLETAGLDGARAVLVREEDGRRLMGHSGTERALAWLRDGRLLYISHPEPDSNPPQAELRYVQVEPKTGASSGTGLLLRRPGYLLEAPSPSADSTLVLIARSVSAEPRILDLSTGVASSADPASRTDRPGVAIGSGAWPGDADSVILCAGSRCVLARADGAEIAFHSFDPRRGRGPVLFRRPAEQVAFAGISPDGAAFAMGSGASDTVEIVDASTGAIQDRRVLPGRGIVQAAAWSSDGSALYVSGVLKKPRYWIRRIPLRGSGDGDIVWASENTWAGNPVPSPDGAKIAFQIREHRNELWRLTLRATR
jgi:Tol biopolymer transport system component